MAVVDFTILLILLIVASGVYLDARKRGKSYGGAFLWSVLTFLLPIVALPAWFIVRPKLPNELSIIDIIKKEKPSPWLWILLLIVILIFVLPFVIQINTTGDKISNSYLDDSASSIVKLELISSRVYRIYDDFICIEGQVKNITNHKLKNVMVVIQWYDKHGNFITSEDALLKFNPLLPRQISPFKVTTVYNPAIERYKISFTTLDGKTIKYKDSRK